jgi:hypothetical protein
MMPPITPPTIRCTNSMPINSPFLTRLLIWPFPYTVDTTAKSLTGSSGFFAKRGVHWSKDSYLLSSSREVLLRRTSQRRVPCESRGE